MFAIHARSHALHGPLSADAAPESTSGAAVRVYEDEVDVDGLRVQSSTEPPLNSFLSTPAPQHGNGAG